MSEENKESTLEDFLQSLPETVKRELESKKDSLASIFKLAFIGEHFIKFIEMCRKYKVDPYSAFFTVMKKFEEDPTVEPAPMFFFIQWLATPTEDNFQQMAKILNVDFDKIIENELKGDGDERE